MLQEGFAILVMIDGPSQGEDKAVLELEGNKIDTMFLSREAASNDLTLRGYKWFITIPVPKITRMPSETDPLGFSLSSQSHCRIELWRKG